MTKKAPQETRARLIQAAIDLVVAEGAAHLTLDAVARAAQVSKGGLLHHFPSKEALLRGIAERAEQLWRERFAHELAQEPEGQPGRWSRAYIRATFDRRAEETLLMQALTRVIAIYPALMESWREVYEKAWEQLTDDDLPEARALTIQVACDGIWLGEVAGLPLIPDNLRAHVRADLLRLTYDS